MARASIDNELIDDYKDFLRHRGLRVWHKDSPEAQSMRERLRHDVAPDLPPPPPGVVRLTGLAGLAGPAGMGTENVSVDANR